MKKIVFGFMYLCVYLFADVIATPTPPKPVHPIVRPPVKPIVPIVYPVINENYYTEVQTSCDEYIRIIEEKDQEISRLKREIEGFKNKEHVKLQKKLQTEYKKELEKFDDRASRINTKNKIHSSE